MSLDPMHVPSDPTKWPRNPSSNLVDPNPLWREVTSWKNWPLGKIRQVEVDALKKLVSTNLFDLLDTQAKDAVCAIVEGRSFATAELAVITPERLTSLVDANNRAELARGGLDIVALLNLAVEAITTGDLCGSQLQAREKIDLMKWLGNKVLPDAKSIDQNETIQRVDRARRTAKGMLTDDLKAMTKQELLDLLDG